MRNGDVPAWNGLAGTATHHLAERRPVLVQRNSGKEGPCHTVVASSTPVTGDEQEITEKSRAGILPLLKQQPGFLAYGVILDDGKIFSMSAWDTEDDAKAADEAARGWVAENLDAQVVSSVVGDYAWLEFADSRP